MEQYNIQLVLNALQKKRRKKHRSLGQLIDTTCEYHI